MNTLAGLVGFFLVALVSGLGLMLGLPLIDNVLGLEEVKPGLLHCVVFAAALRAVYFGTTFTPEHVQVEEEEQ